MTNKFFDYIMIQYKGKGELHCETAILYAYAGHHG
jgi:hypothetical protein